MKAQERARGLLVRRRQQSENRRAAMVGRSGQEIYQAAKSLEGLQ